VPQRRLEPNRWEKTGAAAPVLLFGAYLTAGQNRASGISGITLCSECDAASVGSVWAIGLHPGALRLNQALKATVIRIPSP
jgi:hypothetical protein